MWFAGVPQAGLRGPLNSARLPPASNVELADRPIEPTRANRVDRRRRAYHEAAAMSLAAPRSVRELRLCSSRLSAARAPG